MAEALAGVVLAGGGSRRMGRDKAKLKVQKGTLADLMAEKLHAVGCAPVLLSGPGGIADRYPGRGPLAGLHAALGHAAGAAALLAVPVDMPGLRPQTLRRLGQAPGAAAHYAGHTLPLKLAVTDGIRARLDALLRAPDADLSIRAFLAGLDVRVLPADAVPDDDWINLNTPEHLRRWRQSRETVA